MATKITSSSKQLTQAQVQKLEKDLSVKLPAPYRDFLLRHNGGLPEPDAFDVPKWNGKASILNCFFGITGDPDDDIYEMIETYEDRIPPGFLPIADDAGGNVILLDLKSPDGSLYFWDHEDELDDDGESKMDKSNMFLVAKSIDKLLGTLYSM